MCDIADTRMENEGKENGEFSFASGGGDTGRRGLPKIHTERITVATERDICHDDSTTPVRARTIDQLHSLQKKQSTPTTPMTDAHGAFSPVSDAERQKQQLKSIRYEYDAV